MIKKLSMLITAAVLSGMLPIMNCSANVFAGGDGSPEKPYLIANQEQLAIVADLPDLNYKLINDIELTEKWTTIGSLGDQFSGVFDGDGHKIMNASSTLFNENKGIIKNVSVENSEPVENCIFANRNSGEIFNCAVKGEVKPEYGNIYVAGFLMRNLDTGIIRQCSADIVITPNDYGISYAGGLVAEAYGTISECYVQGNIETRLTKNSNTNNTGGIVGMLTNGQINNCYSNVCITARQSAYMWAGGIAGTIGKNGVVNNTYAYGNINSVGRGGICGVSATGSTITNSFYDRNTTGCTDTGKGIPKTTLGMKMQSIYTDWDFDNVWGMSDDINDGYPYLRWQYADAPVNSAAVEITAASSTDSSLKFISRAEISGEPDISTFGITFIPLSLFEDDSAKSVNVVYDNDEYNIKNGQTYGATLTGIPEQCRDWQFVGKSYIKDSNRKYVWSAAKSASINDTALQNVE